MASDMHYNLLKATDGTHIAVFSNGWCPLAISHACKLTINGVRYRSVNQYMQAYKAKMFGDLTAYRMIMESGSSKTQSELGGMINGFVQSKWENQAEAQLALALARRYDQDKEAVAVLLGTGNAVIAFANYDHFLGIGVGPDDERIYSPADWPGKNVIGSLLMYIRNDLRGKNQA